MTEAAPPPQAQPLHYAVLVRGAANCQFAEAVESVRGLPVISDWHVIYANGDLASARVKAEAWAMENPGQQAVVVAYVDHVQTGLTAKWARP